MARTRKTAPKLTTALPTFQHDGSEFGEWIEDMKPEHMACRDFGHVWRAMTAQFDKEHNSFIRTQRCQRCRAQRTQTLGRDGTLGGNSYVYSEGYTAPAGSGRWDKDARAVLRLASTLRMIQEP